MTCICDGPAMNGPVHGCPVHDGATVRKVNDLLGVNLYDVRSFRADVRIDFDEYGNVLSATLLNTEYPDEEAS